MNRPRKKDRHLPPSMYLKHGSYYLVRHNKWINLGRNLNEAIKLYADATVPVEPDKMPALIAKMMPFIVEGVAPSTVKHYQVAARRLSDAFAEFRPQDVSHGTVVTLLDAYKKSPAVANRLLVVLRAVFDKALDREIVQFNPTHRIKRRKQPTRDRLITPNEYRAIQEHLSEKLCALMDVCVLTGQRIGDVLKIERKHLTDQGIEFQQQKTGKKLVIVWSDELRDAIKRALALQVVAYQLVFAGRNGAMLNHSNVWKSFKTAAEKAHVANVTLHDLRALAATEIQKQAGNATKLLGHSNERTTRSYLRDKAPVVVSGPTWKKG